VSGRDRVSVRGVGQQGARARPVGERRAGLAQRPDDDLQAAPALGSRVVVHVTLGPDRRGGRDEHVAIDADGAAEAGLWLERRA